MKVNDARKLIDFSENILADSRVFLENLDAVSYAKPLELLSQASIGQHTRHFIEFYQCLLSQCLTGQSVDYDRRVRDHSLESDPGAALEAIENVIGGLRSLDPAESLFLEVDYNLDSPDPIQVPTTLARELIYNIEHTVHHLAIIKIGLKVAAPELEIPEHFGVAASTLRFRSTVKA